MRHDDDADRRTYEQVERAFTELTKSVDPDDRAGAGRAALTAG